MKKLFSAYKTILLAIAILFCINEIKAQSCNIILPDGVEMPVCYGVKLYLTVNTHLNDSIIWKHNNVKIGQGRGVFANIKPESNNEYKVQVFVYDKSTGSQIDWGETTITTKPKINITFEQIRMTCSGSNDAWVKATASGGSGSNFNYHWNSPIQPIQYMDDPQVAISLRAYTDYSITVTDLNDDKGCTQTDTVRLQAYENPTVTIYSNPSDTVYLDNPYVDWWYENDSEIEISSVSWRIDGYDQPFDMDSPHVSFSQTGTGHADITVTSDLHGCDTTFYGSIEVLPVNLKIPNIFTPNGDGYNDYFEIGYGEDGKPINDLNEYFLSHKLVIFNRWGRIVYESKDYKNDWDGGKLPDGTYFYVLECKGETDNYRYQGSVMIWNSGR